MATLPKQEWVMGRRRLLRDPDFRPWVVKAGPIRIPRFNGTPFEYLVRSICHQQLAGKAASTIHGRLVDLMEEVAPKPMLDQSDEALRGVGLSRSKIAAVRDLSSKILTGEVGVDDLDDQSDEEIARRLLRVRGIGDWTAHMYLMFKLRRPDIWPTTDLGVRSGFRKIHDLPELPVPKELADLGEPHRPWRSAVAWYCYRALEIELD